VETEPVLWIYLAVRADLPVAVQMVNIAHGASECVPAHLAPLRQDTRIALFHVRDEAHLREFTLDRLRNVPHHLVKEIDGEHAGQVMAVACQPAAQHSKFRKLFHHLPMAKFETP
jgi:hypothetical protein